MKLFKKLLSGAGSIAFILAAAPLSSCNSTSAQAEPEAEPLMMADPTIFVTDSMYYLYGTGHPEGIAVYQSTDLVNWTPAPDALEGLAVKGGRQAYGTKGFWAPQVLRLDDKYYIFYTANENIAVASADNPVGPFTQENPDKIEAPTLQIDPFLFVDEDGSKYLYHVRLHEGNSIWVVRMNDDMTTVDPATFTPCIRATETWEDTQAYPCAVPIIEGPTVVKRGDWYYLFYSANHFLNPDYAVGYAVSKSPMGPWEKPAGNPIIHSSIIGQGEIGTGHGDLFEDHDGQWKYVFHVHNCDTVATPRRTLMVDVNFVSRDNAPDSIFVLPATTKHLVKK